MIHYTSYIRGLLAGIVLGLLSVIGTIAYVVFVKLKQTQQASDEDETRESKAASRNEKEGDLSSEELSLIREAVGFLSGLDSTFQLIHDNPDTFGYPGSIYSYYLHELTMRLTSKCCRPDNQDKGKQQAQAQESLNSKYIGGDVDEMETDFMLCMKELKDKIKNCKGLATFAHELGKAYQSFYKDLSKLAVTANNNTIQGSINLAQSSLFGSSEIDNDPISDRLWASLAKTLEFTAAEYDSIADKLMRNISDKLAILGDDMAIAEKHLSLEGSKRLTYVRETIQQRDKHLKDRDRRRDKASAQTDKNASIMSGLGMKDISEKLFTSEQALNESNARLANAIKDIGKSLPKIIQDALTFSARSIVTVKSSISTMATSMKIINSRTTGLMEDFSRVIESTTTSTIHARKLAIAKKLASAAASNSANSNTMSVKRIDELRDLIFGLVSKMLDSEIRASSASISATEASPTSNQQTEEKAQISADSSSQEKKSSGRIKLDMSLESSSSLAAAPPLKFLSQLPPSFASAIEKETSVWFNAFSGRIYRDIARSEYFHNWFCSKLAYLLNKGNRPGFVDEFKVDDVSFGSTPPILRNVLWTPLFEQTEKKRSASSSKADGPVDPNYLGPLDDPDNDVACLADLSFKSGISFALSTKIWCNWPRDHIASIPITMKLDIREVSGPIKFGVRRNCSFVSFLEEPQTRFKISVEVGNQFKFKDIPLVSDYVESKMRKLIRRRFVYPNAHKARLLWPRSWWPEGTHDDFLPAGPTIGESSPPPPMTSSAASASASASAAGGEASASAAAAAQASELRVDAAKKSKSKFAWMKKSADKRQTAEESTAAAASSSNTNFLEDDDSPEVSLDQELGVTDFEPEYIPSSDSMSSSQYRDSGLGRTSIREKTTSNPVVVGVRVDGSAYELDESESTSSKSQTSSFVTASATTFEENPMNMKASSATASTTSAQPSVKATQASASTTSASFDPQHSSSAWLSNLAQKTKSKFSEFKEKHLRSNDQELAAEASSQASSSSSNAPSAHEAAIGSKAALPSDHPIDTSPASHPRNRAISVENLHIPRPEDFFLPESPRRQHSGRMSAVSSTSAGEASSGSSNSSSAAAGATALVAQPSGGGPGNSHLQSFSRRLQHAKEVIKNEVNKHVEANRKASVSTTATAAVAATKVLPKDDEPNQLNFPPS
jgi:hypothetical protein